MSLLAETSSPPAVAAPRRAGRGAQRARTLAWRCAVPLLLVAVWCAASYGGWVSALYVPSPTEMWQALDAMSSALPTAIGTSVAMTLTGYAIGATLGMTIGLAMAYSRVLRDLFGDLLDLTRPVPVFALIPLFLLWFGIGRGPQVALIALGTSVILGVTTLDAVRNVSPVHVRAAATLGAGRWDIYRTVIVPSIFPHLLGALRVAAAASWGLDVAAELIGSQSGLGYLMIVREQYLDTAGILVVVLIYGVLATALDRLILALERPLTRWTHRSRHVDPTAAVAGRPAPPS